MQKAVISATIGKISPTLVSARLGGICGLGEALRRFSREVEHSDENLERLEEGFCFDERLSPERFFIGLK